MKQSLQLKLSQQLNLTPQLQQSIKLLQLSTLEFRQEIERYLIENPLLEPGEDRGEGPGDGEGDAPAESTGDDSGSEYGAEGDDWNWGNGSGGGSGGQGDDDDFDPASNTARELTLREHLLEQAGLLPLPALDRAVLGLLIDALDDDGFLTQPLEEIFAQLPEELIAETGLELEDLSVALARIKQFEPIGVGARDMAEALAMQLRQLPADDIRQLALQLVEGHLDLLAARDYTRLKKALKCDDAQLKAANTLIVGLNPRPAARWAALTPRYVIPDVIVYKARGKWRARLNEAARPRFRVNRMYADILQRSEGGVLARELQEARWLVKSVQQRFDTILRVAEAIVARQHAFFEHGEVAMRPMVLRDIAEELELHESTISRVTSQKYLHSPRGLFEFKYFFGSHVETEAGGECSATAIKAIIKQLIQNEDKNKPLSDSALAETLSRQGIVVARRTVAKYREAMQIAPVNQRKTL
ncbi:RNA polymerase sigma-54 factor [Chitiniphilus shinanonensis]|uniref:RNA polymerase sigma-54 factor n=1 Tax=Chitiniphilus shinanonensis TaxID=553088 RepID=A0ABQ6BTI0_9NEIS|nr:RNA polymerase factor sigma-54 [Chitiniphilus shinanonensis]GLS04804.1 RNA polymerase sigma-54 factor [Chitiniphilus shinanonensis]